MIVVYVIVTTVLHYDSFHQLIGRHCVVFRSLVKTLNTHSLSHTHSLAKPNHQRHSHHSLYRLISDYYNASHHCTLAAVAYVNTSLNETMNRSMSAHHSYGNGHHNGGGQHVHHQPQHHHHHVNTASYYQPPPSPVASSAPMVSYDEQQPPQYRQSGRRQHHNGASNAGTNMHHHIEDGKSNLYISNLPSNITDSDLRLLFQPYGNLLLYVACTN
jgi:hypothetical protein